RLLLELADLQDTVFQGSGHRLVHAAWVTAFDKKWRVSVADEQGLELLVTNASGDGGVIDLVAVEVQDRQHGPVRDRVEELVTVPAGGEGAGLRFAVTHHYEGDQVWIIVDCPVSVRDAVSQLTALVEASRCFGSGVAANPARERKLFEEALHSRKVFTLVGINL